jgi:hypothetical protein
MKFSWVRMGSKPNDWHFYKKRKTQRSTQRSSHVKSSVKTRVEIGEMLLQAKEG